MTNAVPDAKRKELLAEEVVARLRDGWRVEHQTDFGAVFVRGRPVNHVLHLLLSVFTLGLWLLVWLLVSLNGGETRVVVRINEHGFTQTWDELLKTWKGRDDRPENCAQVHVDW